MKAITCCGCLCFYALMPPVALAQYPKVPPEVQKAEDNRRAAYEKPEDEAWLKAQPELEAWAKKGKPFIPGAAKPSDLPQAKIPAFPGAWGGGMYSFGGRGGKVFVVTSLEDAGPGTLREACNAIGPRIVVFNVAGTIHLKNRIRLRAPYITIAGQTAPGDGICVRGATFEINTHDVVIRHMRFRRGETDVANRDDSLGGNPVGNIIIDHCSTSWGLDENLSMYRHMHRPKGSDKDLKLPTVNITIQWCISSEALDTFNHSFGSTIGGHNSLFHHNLWANNTGRNPSIGMDGDFNFVNNVLYNWRHRTVDGGDQRSIYCIVNNYFKPGPVTPQSAIRYRVLRPDGRRPGPDKTLPLEWGKAYVAGNVVEGNAAVTRDNWDGGVQIEGGDSNIVIPKVKLNKMPAMPKHELQSAAEAYSAVLDHAGATLPVRDEVDKRVIDSVRKGTAATGSKDGIITDIKQVGGYPNYKGQPVKDSDGDGIPDTWEVKYKLNPNDASDAKINPTGDGYTNIEMYINGIDPTQRVDWTDLRNNHDPLEEKALQDNREKEIAEREAALFTKDQRVAREKSIAEMAARLDNTDRIDLFRLNGKRLSENDQGGKMEFHGYEVLAKISVQAKEQRKEATEFLGKTLHWNEARAALCFNPRHGLRAVSGTRTLDFVICFECWRVQVFEDNEYLATLALGFSDKANPIERLLMQNDKNAKE